MYKIFHKGCGGGVGGGGGGGISMRRLLSFAVFISACLWESSCIIFYSWKM